MASVVFLRAVNVGGHQKFQPSALARSLAEFGVVNVGAAGTFVVRESISEARLRQEILRRLPFEPGLTVCPASDFLKLAREEPFGPRPVGEDLRQMVTVLQKPARTALPLPFDQPVGDNWQVRVVILQGRYVLSWWRPDKKRLLYPNEVVEKHFGAPATTRSWNTIKTICALLTGDRS